MNPTGGRYSWDMEVWPEDGHLPSLEEVRAKEEKHGPLTEVEWNSSRSGMMRGDYSTSSLRRYREKGKGRLVCAKMPAFEAETISTYSVADEVFEKLQALADRENLAAWSFLKPDPEKQIFVTDVSSSNNLRLTFDDSSLGAEFPVTRSLGREAVVMAGGEDVWDEVYDLLSGCVMRPKDSAPLREAAAEPTPEPGPVRYRVEFRQDDLALSVQSVEEGSAPEVPAGAEHARLIGWTSGDGRPADGHIGPPV